MNYGYLHRGRIIEFEPITGGYIVEIPTLAPTRRMGPYPSLAANLPVGQRVLLASLATSRDEMVIIGRNPGVAPTMGEIPGLVAALDGKADDAEITALDGRLDVVEPLVASHTSTLASHTSTLASHTSTLSAQGLELISQDTRLDVMEAKIGYVLPVTSVANRPATGLYDGYPIYRTDKGFMEFYDLPNAKWRVRGMVVVSALADITDPVVDQVAFLTTDKMLYRCVNGTTWTGVLHTSISDSGGARYRVASGHPAIANSSITKVQFVTAEVATADVTRAAGNTDFTINRTGWWHLGARVGWPGNTAGTSRWCWIALSSDQANRLLVASNSPASFTNFSGASDAIYMTSGTVLSVWVYQDSGGNLSFDLPQGPCVFTLKWLGS